MNRLSPLFLLASLIAAALSVQACVGSVAGTAVGVTGKAAGATVGTAGHLAGAAVGR